MAATHKLQITFDTASGKLRAVHRTTVTVGGHEVSHAADVDLGDGVAAAMSGMIEQNAAQMETDATRLAIRHAAAVEGKLPQGVQSLKVSGSITGKGDAATKQ